MTFRSLAGAIGALAEGNYQFSYLYKPSIASPGTGGRIVETSMSSGTPKFNAYVGTQLEATPFIGTGNSGIYAGQNVSGTNKKHLLNLGLRVIIPATTCVATLCDYLMYYPLVDLDTTDTQEMDNTIPLSRYESGEGVRMFVVCAVPTTVAAQCTIVYVDSMDVERSVTFFITTGTTSLLINGTGPGSTCQYVPLASGSTGVKRVVSLTMTGSTGGFGHIVLCKPLASINTYEAATFSEISLIADKTTLPEIKNNAYLQFLLQTAATGTIYMQGELLFITG
jgi:hypothetical protein